MIYSCAEHVDIAIDSVVNEYETFPILEQISEEKSYQQPVNIVKIMPYIWWRTSDSILYVD